MPTNDRADYAALSDRMGALLLLRIGIAAIVIGWGAVRPEVLGIPEAALAGVSLGYIALAITAEWARRHAGRRGAGGGDQAGAQGGSAVKAVTWRGVN